MRNYITRRVLKRIDTIQSKELLIKEIAEVTDTTESEVRQHFYQVKTTYYAAGAYMVALILFWSAEIVTHGAIALKSANGQAEFIVLAIASLVFPLLMVLWRNIVQPY